MGHCSIIFLIFWLFWLLCGAPNNHIFLFFSLKKQNIPFFSKLEVNPNIWECPHWIVWSTIHVKKMRKKKHPCFMVLISLL